MRAEILSIGTELLLGHIANTNAQWMSSALAEVGVDVLHHTVVGDNLERIARAIHIALGRSEAVIITGGLGPTHDDLTREAIAEAAGVALDRKPEIVEWLRERFASMGRAMPESNLRQADVPRGAISIPNPMGTAPGISLNLQGKRIYAIPGVPREMEVMMRAAVLPDLSAQTGGAALAHRVLKVVGLGESDVGTRLDPLIRRLDQTKEATIALLAGSGEVRVRISAKALTAPDAQALIAPVETSVRETLGSAVFGADDDTLEGVVASLLREKGLTLAVAESVTGGLVTARIVSVPGASDFLLGGYVAYSNAAKAADLSVSREILQEHGAVSAEAALAMAAGARARAGSDVGISTTGEAGPDPKEAPQGTVHLGIAWMGGSASRNFVAPGDREAIRRWATLGSLNLLRLWLLGEVT